MFSRSIPTFGKPNPKPKNPSAPKIVDTNKSKPTRDTCGLASKAEYAGDKFEESANDSKEISNETTSKKLQTKIKSLQCSLKKKEAIIGELNNAVQKSSEKNDALSQELSHRNASLIELATLNNSLEKQIESKESEINEYQAKVSKNEQIKTNLLKDIEYYKAELTVNANNARERGDQGVADLKKKFDKAKHDNEVLSRKLKEIKAENEKTRVKLNEVTCALDELQRNHELAKVNLESVRSENKRLRFKVKKAQDELSAKTASGEEIVKLKETNSKVMHENKSFRVENSQLKTTIVALEETNGQLIQDKETIAKMVEEIKIENDLKSKLLDQANLQLATNNVQIQDLTQKLLEGERKNGRDSELNMYRNQVLDLENEMKHVNFDKDHIIDKLRLLQVDNEDLKIKLKESTEKESKSNPPTKSEGVQVDDVETPCENCTELKQELEKMGYANLRLNKEKAAIKARFEKLAQKTTKLDLKIERLENQITKDDPEENLSIKTIQENQQKISYYMECYELNKKLKRSEDKFENLMSKFSQYERSKNRSSKITIIEELAENLTDSQVSLRTIEDKLNKEEGKLNSTLDRIKIVKEQLREGRLKLERDGGFHVQSGDKDLKLNSHQLEANVTSTLLDALATLPKTPTRDVALQTSENDDRKLNVFLGLHRIRTLPLKTFQLFGNTRLCQTKSKLREICETQKSNKKYVSVSEYIDANEIASQSIASDAKFDRKSNTQCVWGTHFPLKNDEALRKKMCLSRLDINSKETELSTVIVNFVNDLEISNLDDRLILTKFENVVKLYGELAISALNLGVMISTSSGLDENFDRIFNERGHIDKHVCASSKLNNKNVVLSLTNVVLNIKCGVDTLNRTFEKQHVRRLQQSFSYVLATFYLIYFIACNVIMGNDLTVKSNVDFNTFRPKPIVMYLNRSLSSFQRQF